MYFQVKLYSTEQSLEDQWNDTAREKQKYSEKKWYHWHCPSKIPHGLVWNQSWSCMMRGH